MVVPRDALCKPSLIILARVVLRRPNFPTVCKLEVQMVNVAILYVSVVEEGLKHGSWWDPHSATD